MADHPRAFPARIFLLLGAKHLGVGWEDDARAREREDTALKRVERGGDKPPDDQNPQSSIGDKPSRHVIPGDMTSKTKTGMDLDINERS